MSPLHLIIFPRLLSLPSCEKKKNELLSRASLPSKRHRPHLLLKGENPAGKIASPASSKNGPSRPPHHLLKKKSKKIFFPRTFSSFFGILFLKGRAREFRKQGPVRDMHPATFSCMRQVSCLRHPHLIFLISFLHNFSLRTGGESLPARRRASLSSLFLSKKIKKRAKKSSPLFAFLLPFLKQKTKQKWREKQVLGRHTCLFPCLFALF